MTEGGATSSSAPSDPVADVSPDKRPASPSASPEKEVGDEASPQPSQPTFVRFPPEDRSLIYGAGRAVGDATKLVGGAALGGVGLVTDRLGLTTDAQARLADSAEEAVDLVGDGMNAVVDSFDLEGTAKELKEKGVVAAVSDGMSDAVSLVSDLVGDTAHGIAGGVHEVLAWVSKEAPGRRHPLYETHTVEVTVAVLLGEEQSLGLKLENRVITKFTKAEAGKFGFHLGDCIIDVNDCVVQSQEELLEIIAAGKEALKTNGTPLRFRVERLGTFPGQ